MFKMIGIIIALSATVVCPSTSMAQSNSEAYPNRSVTVVVPFPPGGGTDAGARLIAQ